MRTVSISTARRLPAGVTGSVRLACVVPRLCPAGMKEAMCSEAGIDWAGEFHLVALGRPDQGIIEVLRAGHRPRAVSALVARIAGLEPDPAGVRVAGGTRYGLLAGALAAAGYAVLPASPGPGVAPPRPGTQER